MPKPDGLRMDITPRAFDLCLVSVLSRFTHKLSTNYNLMSKPDGLRIDITPNIFEHLQ